MWGKPLKALAVIGALLASSGMANAQYGDLSPVILVETGPSDNGEYRRMVFVKFLSGDRVSVNYKAYNRAEFMQVPNTTPSEIIRACSNGPATTLNDIRVYEAEEAQLRRQGKKPEIKRFCIKNIQNWEGGNRSTYLDPIFNGMPHAANMN